MISIEKEKSRIIERSIVDDKTGCWIWEPLANKGNEYGHLTIGTRTGQTRKTISAHRYSYSLFVGEIPNGMFVCHKCDDKRCVNPDHLFIGTRQDNVDDRERKKRNNHVVGEKVGNSKLKVKDVLYIRRSNETDRSLAKKFGVSHTTIGRARNGTYWKSQPAPEGDKE